MKKVFLAVSIVFLSACAATPQSSVSLSSDFLGDTEYEVGVAMTSVPDLDVHLPGADCLLCLAVAETANASLSKHAKTLSSEEVHEIKHGFVELINDSGTSAKLIDEVLDIAALPRFSSKEINIAKKDFTGLKEKYGVTHLLVVDIGQLGLIRTYASYVPTSDPKGVFSGEAYIINLDSNVYEWYARLDVQKSVADGWKEPPNYPSLTNAFYQALETGKAELFEPFGSLTDLKQRGARTGSSPSD